MSTSQGLAVLALLAFVASFLVARVFTMVYPNTVVESSGIHFHHFWYGLGMLIVAGWLGIASDRPEYDRVYAVIFGLGLGLVGDETGLLLTLGDYHSELTFEVVVMGVAIAAMLILAARFWVQIRNDVLRLGGGEKAVHLGIGVASLSALPLAFDLLVTGVLVFLVGVVVVIIGTWMHLHRRTTTK